MSGDAGGLLSRNRVNFVRDVLEVHGRHMPHTTALSYIDASGVVQRLTFHELVFWSARWANLFVDLGAAPGERVLVATATVDWPAITMGALKAGLIPAPCDDRLGPGEIADLVVDAGTPLVIASQVAEPAVRAMEALFSSPPEILLVENLRDALARQSHQAATIDAYPNYFALAVFSDRVGDGPRTINHTHQYLFAHHDIADQWLDIRPGDRVWASVTMGGPTAVPLGLLAPWSRGAEVMLHDEPFDPFERLRLVERFDADVLCQPSHEYVLQADLDRLDQFNLARVRSAVSYGPLLPEAVHQRFHDELGLTIREGFGEAETSMILGNTPGRTRLGSLGLPLGGADVAIADAGGNELPEGEAGYIALGGGHPTLFVGYGSEAQTERPLYSGRFVTEQRAVRDDDGYVWAAPREGDPELRAPRAGRQRQTRIARHAGRQPDTSPKG